MSDMDALAEKAARAAWRQDHAGTTTPWRGEPLYLTNARAALEAVGLPALLERVEAAEERERDLLRSIQQAYIERKEHDTLAAKVAAVVGRFGDHTGFRRQMVIVSAEKRRGGNIRGMFAQNADYMIALVDALDDLRAALDASETP